MVFGLTLGRAWWRAYLITRELRGGGALCKHRAHLGVEGIEVSEGRFDDAEEALAVILLKALRLGRVKGEKGSVLTRGAGTPRGLWRDCSQIA